MLGLDIAYMRAKFDHTNFSSSGDMVSAHQNLNGSRYLTTPLSCMDVLPSWASIATVILRAKFEICNNTQ